MAVSGWTSGIPQFAPTTLSPSATAGVPASTGPAPGAGAGRKPLADSAGAGADPRLQPFRTPAGRSLATTRDSPTCSQVSTTAVASL
jgi:hypothetical protein